LQEEQYTEFSDNFIDFAHATGDNNCLIAVINVKDKTTICYMTG